MSRRSFSAGVALAAIAVLCALGGAGGARAAGSPGFAAPTFVDPVRAGGEPGIISSNTFGDLVFTSHEGDTHIDRVGVAGQSIVQFLCPNAPAVDCAKNHVWIWTSDDHGTTWQLRDEGLSYTGFSDPDLTQDAAGSIYNTGIDLANDSVFSSQDGGKTWPHGTAQCHEGDRPWLAGGRAGEVFMTTDTVESGHEVFYSKDSGDSCSAGGIADSGTDSKTGLQYSGFGKLVYDPVDGSLIEPAQFTRTDANGNTTIVGVGISRLPKAADAFNGGGESWQPLKVADTNGVYSPFGAPEIVSMDSAENLYFAWDTDERVPTGSGGCSTTVANTGGGPTPLPNHILLEVGTHTGPGQWAFSPPISLAQQGNARVLWPWSVAGSPGNVSVVWYQMDRMVDPDCDLYNGQAVPDVNTFIYEAHITHATDAVTRQITVTNASGRAIHQGGICDSGTTCVVTGQDRRLGDYFTDSIDAKGCVLIASGDTTVMDSATGGPRVTSLPIFIQQNRGQSLTGGDCAPQAVAAATPAPAATPTGAVQALANTGASGGGMAIPAALGGGGALLVAGLGRRRRRARTAH